MTMVATLNHLSKHHPCGGADHLMNGGAPLCNQYYYYYYYLGSNPNLISLDPHMAEDDSTTNSFNDQAPSNRDDGWLQLSIGGSRGGGDSVTGVKYDQRELMILGRSSSGLVELDLLPGGGREIPTNYSRWVSDFSSSETATTSKTGTKTETGIAMPLFLGTSSSSNFVQQEINWAFRPVAGVGTGVPSSSSPSTSAVSSSYSLPVSSRRSSYLGRPLIQFQSVGVDTATAGPSSDVRIINPPRRPHSGIWFTLKALENQGKEPILPQISKSYLRIKDERMTVGLVMKYLVNKLHLDSESEIEIRCRGQELLPFWTLEYVRDRIWNTSSSNSIFTLLPHTSTTNHLMLLHYGRKD
ncbi:uncharacterized protein LOC120072580 [Benincasa hispida]|uniref:uncharacterized protein LOC120072580 n=1 Tax=Benincasa hispida TaxID=102211 RepID=UPI0018FF237F|nr:uncharacterized protein LOC120072580 [Benincasa hispida]